MKSFIKKFCLGVTASLSLASACLPLNYVQPVSAEEKSESFIADRTITGLIFESAGDASVDIPKEILDEIKKETGITLQLQTVTADDSTTALAAGLAAGDLPDFVAYYLNDSGRPEMQFLLKAANEGQFVDLTPLMKQDGLQVYNKYLEEDYLPTDTRENIMFRPEWDGASYIMHMAINREPAQKPANPQIGGLYIRKDIAEDLKVDYDSVNTSEELYELGKKIKEKGYTDDNGAPVTVFGPTVWGGSERPWLYQDLMWTGSTGEPFMEDKDGHIKHEAQTDLIMKRVQQVHKYLKEGLMNQEYYTMEESRAQEGVVNGSFAIVTDIHSYRPEIQDGSYVPLASLQRADGSDDMVLTYKSGYAGWSIPTTTKNPEEVMKFADWLASRQGKLLYFYGLEGRDYELDEDGNPVVNPDVVKEFDENPDQAKLRGFRGVRSFWGEHLGFTDMDNMTDFGEASWGDKVRAESESNAVGKEIEKYVNYDEQFDNARVEDGLSVQSYLFEFEGDEGKLATALARYQEDVLRMYYAQSDEEAQKILDESRANLEANGLNDFLKFVEEKRANGDTIRF
ncbi:extracellular solute-binding protein [Eremococcus coleocola]|uniref:ABC transporter, solute-binding protein n=1 Tax=Eremococcus coleocola ACS-139-V-Col8 TaxID=908337 RepID=E4KMK7_9LACT|nr:extracellular solute-binding protein [Eremococcus coleocola]EFR31638.1 ABC transporter, solute-binding protein [Eremococcus coleocola ACS-139-V-Col8]